MKEYLLNVTINFFDCIPVTIPNLTPEQAGEFVKWFNRQTRDIFEFATENEVHFFDRKYATHMNLVKVGE